MNFKEEELVQNLRHRRSRARGTGSNDDLYQVLGNDDPLPDNGDEDLPFSIFDR